jgi:hypothetical protein
LNGGDSVAAGQGSSIYLIDVAELRKRFPVRK